MRAGKLRHQGTIQFPAAGSPEFSASGEPIVVWADLATVWMSIEPLSGRELFAAQEHHSDTRVRIRLRYRDDVNAQMRVLHEFKYYEIFSVIDPELRHREVVLMCSEGVIFKPDETIVLEESASSENSFLVQE